MSTVQRTEIMGRKVLHNTLSHPHTPTTKTQLFGSRDCGYIFFSCNL